MRRERRAEAALEPSRFAVNLGRPSKVWQASEVRALVIGLIGLWMATGCGGTPRPNYAGGWIAEQPTIPPAWNPRDAGVALLPIGENCISWLNQLGISYRRLDDLRGVDTPVEVTGPIAGVTYTTLGKVSVTGDCRLVLALDWASRTLASVGISEVRHSGAYVYRTTSRGRPSLHARGLAIDIHAVKAGGTWYDVERDYSNGRGPVCDEWQPFINHIYCRLSQLNLFRELITPDHNAEHHDHFHLGVAHSG
jgi:hypothetical protein